jgi:lipopolysaccharide export system ATP-binding protein
MPETKHTLEVAQLRKRFGKKEVVRGVDFGMHTGEVVGFLGPNGAGKTTVFYMIVGFISPESGQIYLDRQEIGRLPMFRRARLGISYLPQEPSVFRKLTVEENIWAILENRKEISLEQKRERLEQLLEELGIADRRKQRAYTLSGGERRRTEIARSLALNPKFLLLDEPFAGIDPIAVYEIKTIIGKLVEQGIGILITDHNVRDTLEITDRSYIISNGEILVSGSRDEVMESDVARKVYLGERFSM